MKSATVLVERSEATYKAKLLNAKSMRGKGGFAAYDRVTLLNSVFDDRDFRADIGDVDDFRAAAVLSDYTEDLAFKFLELRAMLGYYPERAQWKDGKLRTMYEEMRVAQRAADADPRKRSRTVVTREQYDAVSADKDHAEARAKFLDGELARSRDRIADLERENGDLKHALARAEGRIEELERRINAGA